MGHMKNKLYIVSIFIVFLMLGCAGTQSYIRMLEAGGDIRTDISDDKSYTYKVFIKNTIDINWDGGRESDRIKAVNTMFKSNCKKIKIIDQIPIKRGTYIHGKEAVTWVLKVNCIN